MGLEVEERREVSVKVWIYGKPRLPLDRAAKLLAQGNMVLVLPLLFAGK